MRCATPSPTTASTCSPETVSGALTALDPDDGDVAWSTSFDGGLAQGPLVTDGRVRRARRRRRRARVHVRTARSTGSRAGAASARRRWRPGTGVSSTDIGQVTAYRHRRRAPAVARELPDGTACRPSWATRSSSGCRRARSGSTASPTAGSSTAGSCRRRRRGTRGSTTSSPALVGDDLVLAASGAARRTRCCSPTRPGPTRPRGVHLRLSTTGSSSARRPSLRCWRATTSSCRRPRSCCGSARTASTTVLAETPDTTHAGAVVADGVVVTRDRRPGPGAAARRTGRCSGRPPAASRRRYGARRPTGPRCSTASRTLGLAAVDLHSGPCAGRPRCPTSSPPRRHWCCRTATSSTAAAGSRGTTARHRRGGVARPGRAALRPAAYAGGVVYAPRRCSRPADDACGRGVRRRRRRAALGPAGERPRALHGPAVGDGVVVSMDGHVAHAYDAGPARSCGRWTMRRTPSGSPVVADGPRLARAVGQRQERRGRGVPPLGARRADRTAARLLGAGRVADQRPAAGRQHARRAAAGAGPRDYGRGGRRVTRLRRLLVVLLGPLWVRTFRDPVREGHLRLDRLSRVASGSWRGSGWCSSGSCSSRCSSRTCGGRGVLLQLNGTRNELNFLPRAVLPVTLLGPAVELGAAVLGRARRQPAGQGRGRAARARDRSLFTVTGAGLGSGAWVLDHGGTLIRIGAVRDGGAAGPVRGPAPGAPGPAAPGRRDHGRPARRRARRAPGRSTARSSGRTSSPSGRGCRCWSLASWTARSTRSTATSCPWSTSRRSR